MVLSAEVLEDSEALAAQVQVPMLTPFKTSSAMFSETSLVAAPERAVPGHDAHKKALTFVTH
ncbi:hypothetical protein D3C87_2012920 [compost metagenome]